MNSFIEERVRESDLYKLGRQEGIEVAISMIHDYLDIIKQDNERPTYRWNKESHGVVAVLKYLTDEKQTTHD